MTMPLILRAVLDFIEKRKLDSGRSDLGYALYNLFFALFTIYLPILFQAATLIFGFVRSKQDVKARKHHESLLTSEGGRNSTHRGSTLLNEDDRDPSFFDPPLEFYSDNYTA
jgi:hypothetical protein